MIGAIRERSEPRRAQPQVAIAATVMLAALALALSGAGVAIAAALAVLGAATGLVPLAARTWRALRRHPELVLLVAALALVAAWVIAGLERPGRWVHPPYSFDLPGYPRGLLNQFSYQIYAGPSNPVQGWPWRIGRTPLLPVLLALAAAAAGLVLIADAVRLKLGLQAHTRTPWRQLTAPRNGAVQTAARAVPGVALVVAAAVALIGFAHAYIAGTFFRTLVPLAICGWAALMIGGAPALGAWLALDWDKVGRARESERQRFAAHLHDSVLQTLALIQRQAGDPGAVTRLARRQEHALRAWMAGDTDLAAATLGAALREVAAEVEDEHELAVELTVLGDRKLDHAGETIVAAVREALRNAAVHAPGADVTVFAQLNGGAEVFVRDDGPGFDLDAVPPERRGIRDAIVGRMASVGASAVIESTPGEGTEVILRLS